MDLIIIICVIAIVLVTITLWITIVYNNYQESKTKLLTAENDMKILIRQEFDILNNIGNIINNSFKEEEPFKDLNDLKNQKLSSFELDRKLKEYIAELYSYKEKYSKIFRENDELIALKDRLDETEDYIIGCQNYYNDTVLKYNKSISMFPNVIIAKITHQKEKELYDKLKDSLKL